MMPGLPQAVFFDLDGCLLDTARDFETAINKVLTEEGRSPLKNGEIRAYVTDGSNGIIRAAFHIDEQSPEFPRLQKALLSNYLDCLTQKTRIFPGLEPSLDFLKENQIPWGIVTNKPVLYAQPIIDALAKDCSVLICPDHVKHTKPDPEGLLMACERLAVEPSSCVFAGDHLRDIAAGNAAGMQTIATMWGYIADTEDPNRWGAHRLINEPSDFLDAIQDLFQ